MSTTTRTFTTESSAVNLNSKFFLQNFYKGNRNLAKASLRSDYSKTELSYEDSRALKRAAAKLSSFTYTNNDNGDNLVSTIQAFAETYNNTVDSNSSEDSNTSRQLRKLKNLTSKYGDELKDIGITIEKDGKLSINDTLLRKSSYDEISKVFSDESDYIGNLKRIARRIHTTSTEEIYTMMTGNGGRINIQL